LVPGVGIFQFLVFWACGGGTEYEVRRTAYGVRSTTFLEHATRFMPQAGPFATLTQRFPKNVGQEADQNVGQDPLFFLMPDRAQPEVAFVDAERRFGVRQLDKVAT
jgi:hypothetical protein